VSLAEEYTAFLAAHPPQRLAISGARWELREAGAGPTVLLLPGGFGVAATSFQYLADLSRDYRAIALTYPPYLEQIADLADGVAALLDHCGVERAHIVGGSASGAVAQVLVRRHPTRVSTLILAQTGPPRPQRAWLAEACAERCQAMPAALTLALLRAAVLAFLPNPGADHAFWRAHFAAVVAAHSRTGLAARLRALADYDHGYRFRPADLDAWPGRVAIIEATRDGLLPAAERAALRGLYPRATVYPLAGGRHADSVTDPTRQLAAIRKALGY
jgi:pimeloyl-ACP methyl ester carboxylesterase